MEIEKPALIEYIATTPRTSAEIAAHFGSNIEAARRAIWRLRKSAKVYITRPSPREHRYCLADVRQPSTAEQVLEFLANVKPDAHGVRSVWHSTIEDRFHVRYDDAVAYLKRAGYSRFTQRDVIWYKEG